MKQLVENLNQLFADFAKDAASQMENGNKAAGTRARKTSLAIEKALKEPKSKYKFSLHFDTIDLLKYSAFRKCYAENFTSEKIVYKTK